MQKPSWHPDWTGETCAIVGAGESATPETVEKLRGRCRVVVVNNSFLLAPWADALYAADDRWWQTYPEALSFSGLKITQDEKAAKRLGIHHAPLVRQGEKDEHTIRTGDGLLGRGSNSGFQALNLAILFGATRVLALLDYRGKHWHGDHRGVLRNPYPQSLVAWAKTLDDQADRLKQLGVELIDISTGGALTAYPKKTIAEALR